MPEAGESCGACKYWVPFPSKPEGVGECRRLAGEQSPGNQRVLFLLKQRLRWSSILSGAVGPFRPLPRAPARVSTHTQSELAPLTERGFLFVCPRLAAGHVASV